MDIQELRKKLDSTQDKYSVLSDIQTLKNSEFTINDLIEVINKNLNDKQKYEFLKLSHIKGNNPILKAEIISSMSSDDIKMEVLKNDEIMDEIPSYKIINDIIKKSGEKLKEHVIMNREFIQKYDISSFSAEEILFSLNEETKFKILKDENLVKNVLKISDYKFIDAIKTLSEEHKEKIISLINISDFNKTEVIKTFRDNKKQEYILNGNIKKQIDVINIIASMNAENAINFMNDNIDFCKSKDIYPYEITYKMSVEDQKKIALNIEKCNISLNEKREVLALLKNEVKESIDLENINEKYRNAFNMQSQEYVRKIKIDYDKEPEEYEGLDRLISINPDEISEKSKEKFYEISRVCPSLKIINKMGEFVEFSSSVEDYFNANVWIENVINKLNPEYSDIQKLAVIDNEIGKKISYSPDFDTEVFDMNESRALWKIINSGYGVCNGIANIEKYILDKVGIESEIIGGEHHAFLKIKDIEIPTDNGNKAKGNTILDPTWNLTEQRFGALPDNFCIDYETVRKHDIDSNGIDHGCHKNDEKLKDANLKIDEKSLRMLYSSVGLADIDGNFPVKKIINESKDIDTKYSEEPLLNIKKQFELLCKIYPEFTSCQNSSISILRNVLLNKENMGLDKCIINRVYDREDKSKKPVMYVCVDSEEIGRKFFYADKEKKCFVETSKESFIEKFECYEKDLEKNNGIYPWDKEEIKKEDLAKSSGKIISDEGVER